MDPIVLQMAQRARHDPIFFGSLLERYAQAHHLDDEGLAAELGVSLNTLCRLRLCGQPSNDADLETLHATLGARLETLRAVCALRVTLSRVQKIFQKNFGYYP